jgi:hypothetical protein
VILDSNSCCIQDRITGLLIDTGPRRLDSQCLWELDWLHLPSAASTSLVGSAASTSSTSSFAQWASMWLTPVYASSSWSFRVSI